MTDDNRRLLVRHGAAIIALGLLAGLPYTFVILGQMEGELRAWRMAHLEGVLNGMLLWAVAGLGGVLRLSSGAERWTVIALLVTGYGNIVASILGALTGTRGLAFVGAIANDTVALLFVVAVVAVVVAVVLIARGARRVAG